MSLLRFAKTYKVELRNKDKIIVLLRDGKIEGLARAPGDLGPDDNRAAAARGVSRLKCPNCGRRVVVQPNKAKCPQCKNPL
jgi:hypothetical protein